MTRDVMAAKDLVELSAKGDYHTILSSCLCYSTLANLGKRLQATEPETFSRSGCVQSWIGMAELMGIDNEEVNNLRENRAHLHCFKVIFDIWKKKPGSTVGALISHLEELERYDILEEETIIKLIKKDVDHYLESKSLESQDSVSGACSSQSQHNGTTPSPNNTLVQLPYYRVDETAQMTVGDVKTGTETIYDAYVSYVEEDIKFVKQLIQRMENEPHNLKLCVDARDLLGGQSRLTVTAKLIQTRCKKVIVVVSKEFLKSEICLFQVRFAHAMSPASVTKRLVPILIDPDVTVGHYLQEIAFLTKLPYKRSDTGEWFWDRLICSVKSTPVERELDENVRDLSEIEIETALLPSSTAITDASTSESSSSESEADEGIHSMSSCPSIPVMSSSSSSNGTSRSSSFPAPSQSISSPSQNIPPALSQSVRSPSATVPPVCSASTGHLDLTASSSSETLDSLRPSSRKTQSFFSRMRGKIKSKKKTKENKYSIEDKKEAEK